MFLGVFGIGALLCTLSPSSLISVKMVFPPSFFTAQLARLQHPDEVPGLVSTSLLTTFLASAAAQLPPAQDAVGQRKALGESTANEKAFQTAREDATNDNAFGDSPRPRDRSRQARPKP